MAEFLDTLDFLTPDQRAILAAEDLTSPAAFKHITIEALKGFSWRCQRLSNFFTDTGGATSNLRGASSSRLEILNWLRD